MTLNNERFSEARRARNGDRQDYMARAERVFDYLEADPVAISPKNIVKTFYSGATPGTPQTWRFDADFEQHVWLLQSRTDKEVMLFHDYYSKIHLKGFRRYGFSAQEVPKKLSPRPSTKWPPVVFRHQKFGETAYSKRHPVNADDDLPRWWHSQRDLRLLPLCYNGKSTKPLKTNIIAGTNPNNPSGPPQLMNVIDVLHRAFPDAKEFSPDLLNEACSQVESMRMRPNEYW